MTDKRHHHWDIREKLAGTLLAKLRSLRTEPPLKPWTVSALATFREFLDHSLKHNHKCFEDAARHDEAQTYRDINEALTALQIEQKYADLRAHAMTVLQSEDLDLADPGSKEALASFLSEGVDHETTIHEVEDAEREIERLTHVLQLLSFLPRRIVGKAGEDVAKALSERIHALSRIFHDETGGGEKALTKRKIMARLLWAEVVRLYRNPEGVADLDVWWSLLQSFEELGAIGDESEPDPEASSQALEHEAGSIFNVLRFAQELDVLQRQRRRVSDTFSGGAQDLSLLDSIDELRNYLRDLLLERTNAFCGRLSELLDEPVSEDRQTVLELECMSLALYSKALLQYQNLYIGPGIRKFHEIIGDIGRIIEVPEGAENPRGLLLNEDGLYFPGSPMWTRYADQCQSLRTRIEHYVEAYRTATDKTKVKPFVILLLGRPGTGKSQFIDNVVSATVKRCLKAAPIKVDTNLSQATSIPKYLEAVWTTLERINSEIALLVFDEFDAVVEGRSDQFRYALAPLWDGRTQFASSGRRGDIIEDIRLGAFIGVCIMSKVETLSAARRMLLTVDKGLDFLSRVDAVVEIPFFDRVTTQVELSIAAVHRLFADENRAQIGEICLWCLGWLNAVDNFRTISKALKTVPKGGASVVYQNLNLHKTVRREFELLLCEYARRSHEQVQRAIDAEAAELMLEVTISDKERRIEMKRNHGALENYLSNLETVTS